MLGPPALRLSWPLTARIESRTSSAVSRRMLKRQNSAFAGSIFRRLVIGLRRHVVGIRRHDEPVHPLDLPAASHEFVGQPVEQFRMRRRLAELAEVVGRRHDAAAEVVLPQPIDEHPRRQRIVLGGDPVRQHRAPAARLRALIRLRPAPASANPSTLGKPGTTLAPGLCGLPRAMTNVSGGLTRQ